MNDKPSQQRSSPPLPWGPVGQPDPIQEYRVLAHELEESYPDTEPCQLDLMIVCEMVDYGDYSVEAIAQAMRVASRALASGQIDDPDAYVARTVDEAMRQGPTQEGGLGWG